MASGGGQRLRGLGTRVVAVIRLEHRNSDTPRFAARRPTCLTAAIMSLVQSARINGHEPHAYLKDVLERLPTQLASRIGELLPHCWQPSAPT